MVISLRDVIMKLVNAHLTRILDAAAVGIPGNGQFQAFRKMALDEFGNQGFLQELDALLQQHGKERAGQHSRKGGAAMSERPLSD